MPHEHFDIVSSQGTKGWQLELSPIDQSLKQVFVSILLAGDKQLDQFTMIETNGDETRIEFYELSYQ